MPRLPRSLLRVAVSCALLGTSAAAAFAFISRHPADAEDTGPSISRAVSSPPHERPPASPSPAPPAGYGLLDGVPMTDAEVHQRRDRPPMAVMIDNWIAARPQIGLDRAEMVYEALVEYGITRFLAVYWRNDAEVIAPVRSARTQFLSLALEWGALYAHVGAAATPGPADAMTQLRAWGVRDVDELEGELVIKRDPARAAPHNAYTSTAALHAYAQEQGWNIPTRPTPWPFKADGGADGTAAPAVDMDFDITGTHNGAFTVRWEYDPTTNSYLRSQAGAPHTDGRSGARLSAKNVIIHIATVQTDVDRDRHVLYALEGTGRAIILRDGRAIAATWQKDTRTSRTRYLDVHGRDIPLNRGTIWIALLPAGQPVTVSSQVSPSSSLSLP